MRKLLISVLAITLYVSTANAGGLFGPGGFFDDVEPGEFVRFLKVDMKLRGHHGDVAPLIVGTIETTEWPIAKLPHATGIETACQAHIATMKFMFKKIDRQLRRQYKRHYDGWESMDNWLASYELENSENLLDNFACTYLPVAFGSLREDKYAIFSMAMTPDAYGALRYDVKRLVEERKELTCEQVRDLEAPLTRDDLPFLHEFLVKFRDGFSPSFD